MALTRTARAESNVRSVELRTKREVFAAFAGAGSPRVIAVACAAASTARLVVGRFGWIDVLLVVITAVMVGPVEWFIHRFLLHAPEKSFRMRTLQTGVGHREHHLDPPHLGWLLLSPIDAAVFTVMIAGFVASWAIPLLFVVDAVVADVSILAGYLTGLALAYLSLGHYEWTHLLVHTSYRPRSRFYRRLARNHRLHHYRNENYWLGVTSNLGDRIMGTYPAEKTDVPLSDTARTL